MQTNQANPILNNIKSCMNCSKEASTTGIVIQDGKHNYYFCDTPCLSKHIKTYWYQDDKTLLIEIKDLQNI